ncbi:MAG: HAD family phosphatase [Planctomycetota bacterium]
MPPEFLYFDLGNVLLTFSNEQMCQQMAAVSGVSAERVREAIYPYGDTRDPQWRFEAGGYTEDAYYAFFCQAVEATPPRAELEVACADMFAPIEATHRLAEGLAAAGCRLGLLSNTNAWHWRFVLDGRFAALNRAFGVQVTSFAVGAMKPDRKIYDAAIAAAGCETGRIFFTDDRPENVQGALDAGMDAVLFTGAEQLAADLAERGVTPA